MKKPIIVVALQDELPHDYFLDIPVVHTGVGKVNAAVKTMNAILSYDPDCIINYGTAGSLKDHLSGLLPVLGVCQRDVDCKELAPRGMFPKEHELFLTSGAARGVICGTGDSFVTDPDEWTKRNCDIVDMELYAVAKVATLSKILWFSVKFVSDKADKDAILNWKQTVSLGEEHFKEWLSEFKERQK
jgi:adenosylhomocysteine nucleosidase